MGRTFVVALAALTVIAGAAFAQTPQQRRGKVKGAAWQHTQAALADAVAD